MRAVYGTVACAVREVLEKLVPSLRTIGFRGSGQTYRKTEGDFVFVVNFQGSRSGDEFYVNLGAQPKEYAQTLRAALTAEPPDTLLQQFSAGTTRPRAALHLARAALALDHRDVARALAVRGRELASDGAIVLVAELSALLESLDR